MTAFLSARSLVCDYDGVKAVDDVSFDVSEGEFVALLGPSGCGKSTTLKMIAGLEEPTSGQILIKGMDVTQQPPGKRHLSMVFQSYALFPHLSVTENILFGLKARGVAKQEQKLRLDEAADLVGLGDQLHKKPGQLSGGQCQRVALARAIVSRAPLCLMDEPLSNLDAKLRNEMRSEIRRLQKALGLTVIYVTHDQVEAMSMADRIILLNGGKIEQAGAPATLYAQPSSVFVAGFIGHPPMNLLSRGDQVMGIRPEHIAVTSDAAGMAVEVLDCDYHGADTLVTVRFRDESLNMSVPGHHDYPVGHPLSITWDARNEHCFSAETGQHLAASTSSQMLREGIAL